jgi:hypothetical protein
MAQQLKLYRTYRFIDKDPVIDEIRRTVPDEGQIRKLELQSRRRNKLHARKLNGSAHA